MADPMHRILAGAAALLLSTASCAALLGRAPMTPGGSDYQAYYDTDLNITWLADMDLPVSQSFGVDYNPPGSWFYNGRMTWDSALAWVAAMNASNSGAGHLGVTGWRLPRVIDAGAPGCDSGWHYEGGGDCGVNIDPSSSEFAHLFYVTLGNQAGMDSAGYGTSCAWACFTNRGPFVNFMDDNYGEYWTETPVSTDRVWVFRFKYGEQSVSGRLQLDYVLPVTDGDPFAAQAAVPVPAVTWLFGSALGALGLTYRLRDKIRF